MNADEKLSQNYRLILRDLMRATHRAADPGITSEEQIKRGTALLPLIERFQSALADLPGK